MKVISREGNLMEFDSSRIFKAIKKAFNACKQNVDDKVIWKIVNEVPVWDEITVEEIQDQVIEILRSFEYDEIADSYSAYRSNQSRLREIEDKLDYQNTYINSTENAATASETDGNANVVSKNVATLESEDRKRENREIQRYRMKRKLKRMFPEVASQYEVDLNNHIIYTHDEASTSVLKIYCMAVSLYSLMTEGVGNIDGVTPHPPKNLDSFCGQFVNLVFLLASQVKGAVAFGGLFVAFNWYCVKEWGKDYYKLKDKNVFTGINNTQRTVEQQIVQYFQQIIWGINQPAGNRSSQSPFTNVSYYDKNYYAAMFDDFAYPDTTKPEWEQIDYLQRLFMRTLNKERLTSVIAFPVETMCLLSNGKDDILDTEYKNFTAQMYAEGHSFFTYISDSPNALASCCFDGDEVITIKNGEETSYMTISDFVNSKTDTVNKFGQKINENITIKAYDINGNTSDEKITGVLKKQYTGKLYTFDTDEGSITVTADHPMMVQDESGNVLEVGAEEVAKNMNKYCLASE